MSTTSPLNPSSLGRLAKHCVSDESCGKMKKKKPNKKGEEEEEKADAVMDEVVVVVVQHSAIERKRPSIAFLLCL